MQTLIDLNQNQVLLQQNQEILGLFVMRGNEELTSKIRFINTLGNSFTRVNLKFVLFDEAKVDLEATIVIKNGAHLTDTYLKIDALLMSPNAKAHIVPCMEITENEVKGGHGATIGMLDEMQLWYLMSRGMDQTEAERLIIKGFVEDMIGKAQTESIKTAFVEQLQRLD